MWDVEHVLSRLAAMAGADPKCQKFGAGRHRYRLEPVLSEAEVSAFEEQHGVTLPEAYRNFVTQVGDGGAGPFYGLFRLKESRRRDAEWEEREIPDFLATPFPHTEAWTPDPYKELDGDEYDDPQWITGSLNIAEFGCGAFLRLVITGPERGHVWFDDRPSDGGLTRERGFYEWYMDWLTNPKQYFL